MRSSAVALRDEAHAVNVKRRQMWKHAANGLRDRRSAGSDLDGTVAGVQEAVVPAKLHRLIVGLGALQRVGLPAAPLRWILRQHPKLGVYLKLERA